MLFGALSKAEFLISTAAHQKFDLDLYPWPLTFISTFDLDLEAMEQWVKNTIFGIWS